MKHRWSTCLLLTPVARASVEIEDGGRIGSSEGHLPCGGSMMLMDGQLSHTGLDVCCRLLSAVLAADDEVDCEDIDQTE